MPSGETPSHSAGSGAAPAGREELGLWTSGARRQGLRVPTPRALQTKASGHSVALPGAV